MKDAIAAGDLTHYGLGKLAEVDSCVIGRFMSGERGIRGETIDRLAEALGLQLVARSRGRGRPSAVKDDPGEASPTASSEEEAIEIHSTPAAS